MTALDGNPWATDQPPEPRSLSRADRIEAAARAMSTGSHTKADSHAWGVLTEWAADILQAAYPELTTAAELDALPMHAVLIGPGGIAYERVVAPGNTLVRNPDRCWAQQAWTTTRISSADLVRNGEVYVLVHRSAA